MVVLALVQAAQGGLGVLFALLLRNIVDDAVAGDQSAFWQSVLLAVALVAFQIALSATARWLQELAKSSIENLLKQRLADNVLRKEHSAVSATHTAEWLNRLTNDTTVVANGFVEILPGIVGTVVQLLSAVVMVVALDPMLAAILVPGGVAMCALAYAFRRVLKRLHKDIQERDGQLRVFLQEHIGNLMIIKSYAAEGQSSDAAALAMGDHKAARMRRNRFSNVLTDCANKPRRRPGRSRRNPHARTWWLQAGRLRCEQHTPTWRRSGSTQRHLRGGEEGRVRRLHRAQRMREEHGAEVADVHVPAGPRRAISGNRCRRPDA